MSLEDRIKGISVACNPSGESMRHKASTLAAEADELMREMAEVLSKVAVEQEGTHAGLDADFVLTKYFMFREQNQ